MRHLLNHWVTKKWLFRLVGYFFQIKQSSPCMLALIIKLFNFYKKLFVDVWCQKELTLFGSADFTRPDIPSWDYFKNKMFDSNSLPHADFLAEIIVIPINCKIVIIIFQIERGKSFFKVIHYLSTDIKDDAPYM